MSPQLRRVEEEALLLPIEDREALVERLLKSLRQEAVPQLDPEWIAEAERRYREVRDGRVEGIPAEQVFQELQRDLAWSG